MINPFCINKCFNYSTGIQQPSSVALRNMKGTVHDIKATGIIKSIVHCQHLDFLKPHRTLSHMLMHMKDPLPQECRKGVAYKVPCSS